MPETLAVSTVQAIGRVNATLVRADQRPGGLHATWVVQPQTHKILQVRPSWLPSHGLRQWWPLPRSSALSATLRRSPADRGADTARAGAAAAGHADGDGDHQNAPEYPVDRVHRGRLRREGEDPDAEDRGEQTRDQSLGGNHLESVKVCAPRPTTASPAHIKTAPTTPTEATPSQSRACRGPSHHPCRQQAGCRPLSLIGQVTVHVGFWHRCPLRVADQAQCQHHLHGP